MTNKSFAFALLSLVTVGLTGCKDYITELSPGTSLLEDFFISGDAAKQCVTGCYEPMICEYNVTYCPEWFIGDVVSDDALKGGQTTNDMEVAYDMENWKTTSTNELSYDRYKVSYMGIARCNLALKYIEPMKLDSTMDSVMKNRYLGEVHFLRAYYYFHLVRLFGGVPLSLQVEEQSDRWTLGRATTKDVYNQIIADLEFANKTLWVRSKYPVEEMGRATKGAAQGLLQKVYLYMASPYWYNKHLTKDGIQQSRQDLYKLSKQWGDSLFLSKEYDLVDDYEYNFTLLGENNIESVFEFQYTEVPWGDYGEAAGGHIGYTAGSFTQILIRSRSSQIGGGWGFNHPTYNLYNEFEAGDPRRDVTIYVPDPAMMDNVSEETYCGDPLLNNKYSMYRETADSKSGIGKWGYHQSRGPLNRAYMRLADNYLMYAEACLELNGDATTCIEYINKVRRRVSMPEYDPANPYPITVNGKVITSPTVKQALRHERRMELAMEAHRWFDLVRWSDETTGETVKAHMEAYQATESDAAKSHLATFELGKHELFPIPQLEIERNTALVQNWGY